jgi:integral membrane protein
MFRTPLALFRTLAILEVISWTLLIAALVVRAVKDELGLVVTIGGGIHGFVFLSYGATAILVALNNRWRVGPTALALVSAIIPYATIPTEIWLHRRGLLAGAWRQEQTDDPRDRVWYDRALRWFLRRPWVLALLIAAAVVVLYVVLLILGPPGGAK